MSPARPGAAARAAHVAGAAAPRASAARLVLRAPAHRRRARLRVLEVLASCPASRSARCSPTQAGSDEPQNFLLVGVDSAANLADGRPRPRRPRQRRRAALRHGDDPAGRARRRAGVAPVAAPRPLGAARQRRQPAHQQRHPERRPRRAHRHDRAVLRHPDPPLRPGRLRRLPGARRRDRRRRACTSRRPPATPAPASTSTTAGCVTLDGQQALALRAVPPLPALRGRSLAHRPVRRPRARSAGSRTSSSGRSTGRWRRARATRSPSIGSSTPGSPPSPSTTCSPPTTSSTSGRPSGASTPARSITYSLPTRPGSAGGASILRLQDEEAQPILDRFRGTDRGDLRPRDVRVLVLNGSGLTGHAGETSDALTAAGFGAAGTGEAERFDVTETARPLHGRERGQGRPGGPLPRSRAPASSWSTGPLDADVVVVTGSLLTGVRADAAAAGPVDHRHDHARPPHDHHDDRRRPARPPRPPSSATCPQAPEGVDC